MKIAWLFRYQRTPMFRGAWIRYQKDCRIYGDEINLAVNDFSSKYHPANIAMISMWAKKMFKEAVEYVSPWPNNEKAYP